jgi:hypothetical protein|nr:hypothetical protein [uncultured Acetatifactor sp.]
MKNKLCKTIIYSNTIAVDTMGLMQALNCGRVTAVKIGTDAGAKIQIGKRVLWSMSKIRKFVDELAE